MPTKNKTKTKKRTKNKSKDKALSRIRDNSSIRYPRPLGLTYAMIGYHNEQVPETKQETLQKAKQLLINTWSANGLMLNNKLITIGSMATFLNIPVEQLTILMNKQLIRLAGFMDDDKTKVWARAQFFGAFNLGLESQALARMQVHTLLASQGDTYSPFITTEVNKAIANLTNAQKPIMDLLKLTLEKNNVNTLINLNTSAVQESNAYIGPDQAIKLIRENSQSLLMDEAALGQKAAAMLGTIPEVNARAQDLTSIGLKNSTEMALRLNQQAASDGPKPATTEGTTASDRHRKRASDLGTIDDADLGDFTA